MATVLQFRRGTAAEAAAFTGAEGELFLDADNMIFYIHDGAQLGGYRLANFSDITLDNVSNNGNTTTGILNYGGGTVTGSIFPDVDITYDLGSSTKQWRDVYVGPGSLYVNGQQVITDNSGTITISADINQGIQVSTLGTGNIQLSTVSGVIQVGGTLQMTNGNTITDSAGVAVQFGDALDMNTNRITELGAPVAATDATTKDYVDTVVAAVPRDIINEGNSSVEVTDAGSGTVIVTIDGASALSVDSSGVTVAGNLIVNGATATVNANAVTIADNILTLNSDATGAPSESVGIEVERGDSTNVSILYNETTDRWTFTNDGGSFINIATNTTDLAEGTNLYYTDARARAAVSASGDISYDSGTGVFSSTNTLDSVTTNGATTTNAITTGDLQVNGNITTTGYIAGPATMTIDPAVVGENSGTLVIAGNLQVDGTTTTINSSTLTVTDLQVVVAQGAANAAAANGAGLAIDLGTDGQADLTYVSTGDYFNFDREARVLNNRILTTADEGTGNGLDADTLDGQEGSYYAVAANVYTKTEGDARYLRGDAADSHSGTITPTVNNSIDLGSASFKYANVYATTFQGVSTTAKYADLAEKYTVEGEPQIGQVVLIGGEHTDCVISDEIASNAVLGVMSENPAFKMNSDSNGEYIALKGRVQCKVFGPIKKGEPLVSSTDGRAMGISQVDPALRMLPGIIFGKALEASEGMENTIEVVVL